MNDIKNDMLIAVACGYGGEYGCDKKLFEKTSYEINKEIRLIRRILIREGHKWYKEKTEGKSCQWCGYSNTKVLVCHHIETDNKYGNICNMITYGTPIDILNDEWNKCVLICRNCHAMIHIDKDFNLQM